MLPGLHGFAMFYNLKLNTDPDTSLHTGLNTTRGLIQLAIGRPTKIYPNPCPGMTTLQHYNPTILFFFDKRRTGISLIFKILIHIYLSSLLSIGIFLKFLYEVFHLKKGLTWA